MLLEAIRLPQGWTYISRGLLECERPFLQLRVSREQESFLWGAPFHQKGFGSEIMLTPHPGQQLSLLLSASADEEQERLKEHLEAFHLAQCKLNQSCRHVEHFPLAKTVVDTRSSAGHLQSDLSDFTAILQVEAPNWPSQISHFSSHLKPRVDLTCTKQQQ